MLKRNKGTRKRNNGLPNGIRRLWSNIRRYSCSFLVEQHKEVFDFMVISIVIE